MTPPLTESEIRHAAQFRPGSVAVGAVVIRATDTETEGAIVTPYYDAIDVLNSPNIDAVEVSYWHCPVCGTDGIKRWSVCPQHSYANMVFGLGIDCVTLKQRELLT